MLNLNGVYVEKVWSTSHQHGKFFTTGLIVLSFVLLHLWLNGRIEMSVYESYGFMGNWLGRPALAILSFPVILEFVCGTCHGMVARL